MSAYQTPLVSMVEEERLTQLRALFPEAFGDGVLNWEALQELIGRKEPGARTEPFGLTWPGKWLARRTAMQPSYQTLIPMTGQGYNEACARDFVIEGNNLEVLKLLQKSYAGRVKMIYIDPPYNTGKDFVYNDNFIESVDEYLTRSGQQDRQGALTTNSRASGRFHSNWLNMLYPRLLLARNLLQEDGLVFVSIDDVEVGHLRLLMDELFGEENFITQFVWNSSTAGGLRSKHVNQNHEYALCYARNKEALPMLFAPLSPEAIDQYNREDERGRYREKDFAWRTNARNPNQRYLVECPDGTFVQPAPGYLFRFVEESFQEALADDLVVFKATTTSPLVDESGRQAAWNIYIKKYLEEGLGAPSSLVPKSIVGLSNAGTEEIKALFDGQTVFNNPKSTAYLKYYLQIGMGPDDLVLDFFGGSGSLGEAVWALNQEDGGRRRFLLVQLPETIQGEPTAAAAGLTTIAELCRERLRRAATAMTTTNNEALGFRSYRLSPSHFRTWEADGTADLVHIQHQFDLFTSPLVEGWRVTDLLTEIQLREGFPLESTVTRCREITNNQVWQIVADHCNHRLFLCLDNTIESQIQIALPPLLQQDNLFVCLDSALTDQSKSQLAGLLNLKTI